MTSRSHGRMMKFSFSRAWKSGLYVPVLKDTAVFTAARLGSRPARLPEERPAPWGPAAGGLAGGARPGAGGGGGGGAGGGGQWGFFFARVGSGRFFPPLGFLASLVRGLAGGGGERRSQTSTSR